MKTDKYTALIHDEDGGYGSLCPELDVASQGDTGEEARQKGKEAVEMLLEVAAAEEVTRREHRNVFVTQFEVEESDTIHA